MLFFKKLAVHVLHGHHCKVALSRVSVSQAHSWDEQVTCVDYASIACAHVELIDCLLSRIKHHHADTIRPLSTPIERIQGPRGAF